MIRNKSNDTFPSEDALYAFLKEKISTGASVRGIGDDAAVFKVGSRQLAITTDSLVENVHFKSHWVTPYYLGQKSARSNLSDIAAMGATPLFALVSLILPKNWYRKSTISRLYDGFDWAFKTHNVEIIGGNISSGKHIAITLTIIGEVGAKPLLRNGAGVGDCIFYTGQLGKSAREVSRLLLNKSKHMVVIPPDRIKFSGQIAKKNLATSCIDISDSLAIDLARLCRESKVGATLKEAALKGNHKPHDYTLHLQNILYGGEDYELLFTVPKNKISGLLKVARQVDTPIVEIGVIHASNTLKLEDAEGHISKLVARGWDHTGKS